jgi:hypothetical protein
VRSIESIDPRSVRPEQTLIAMSKLLIILVLAFGCENANVPDWPCDLGSSAIDPAKITASYPSLDCPSHLCIHTPRFAARERTTTEDDPRCTTSCFSDDDCADWSDPSCAAGFSCEVPTIEGDACCLRMCVCRADRALLPGAEQVAASCTVSSSSTCRNLPGRY